MNIHLATQCVTINEERGCFLYSEVQGTEYPNFRFVPVSPVFPGLIELYTWCRAEGWTAVAPWMYASAWVKKGAK